MIKNTNHLKKLNAALLIVCMMASASVGCGKTDRNVDDVVTVVDVSQDANTDTNEQNEQTEEALTSSEPEETSATAEAFIYYAFMNGDGVVSDNRNKDILSKGNEYDFQSMTEALHEYVNDNFDIPYLGDISYSFIDCGADGIQELALKFEFCEEENQAFGNYIEYLIVKADEEGIRLVYDGYTFYRCDTNITDTGYIRKGGSDSAVSHTYDTSFINSNGEEVFLFTENYIMGLKEPVIPTSYLPSNKVPDGYMESSYSDELAYSLLRYNFNDISVEEMMDSDSFDKYKNSNFFVFSDYEGNDISENDYDSDLYKSMGIEVIGYNDALSKISSHAQECGLTQEIKEGKDIEWYSYDKKGAFTNYKYANTVVEVDKTSAEEQLKLLANSQYIWKDDVTDKSNSYVYYAVTDLDLNGRLEVIRCDYCYLPEFCKNRFYEVTPDYKSVRKMDYDVETMWANGEESGSSHGLLNAQLPVYCFWNSDYGSDASDYTGISYYYIIPTREVHEEYESVVKMALCANNSGKIFTDFVGYANMNNETGEVTHMDYNGFEATEEEFAKAEFNAYSADTGWQCDKVNWLFFSLEGGDNVIDLLTDSYNHYSHETTIRLY